FGATQQVHPPGCPRLLDPWVALTRCGRREAHGASPWAAPCLGNTGTRQRTWTGTRHSQKLVEFLVWIDAPEFFLAEIAGIGGGAAALGLVGGRDFAPGTVAFLDGDAQARAKSGAFATVVALPGAQ